MKVKVYTVRDEKVGCYMQPFFCLAHGQALRQFGDTVADGQTLFAKHPGDFSLFYIGEFDDATGFIECVQTPQHLATGTEFVEPRNGEGESPRLLQPAEQPRPGLLRR